MLEPGAPAPDVEARNQDGERVRPTFEEPTVLYFYPRDGTPGCTLEAREFQDELSAFREAGVTVYGVSTDDVEAHREFAGEEGLDFDLLADSEGEVANAFGLDVSEGYVDRVTFVLENGEVQEVVDADTIEPEGHASEVLEEAS